MAGQLQRKQRMRRLETEAHFPGLLEPERLNGDVLHHGMNVPMRTLDRTVGIQR